MDIKECCGDEGECRNVDLIAELQSKLEEVQKRADAWAGHAGKACGERDELKSRLDRYEKNTDENTKQWILDECAMRAELDEYRQELQTHCGCEFDGAKQTVECLVHRNQRVALESRLEECLDLIADAVANHESGGRCDMDLARAAVVLARNETAVEIPVTNSRPTIECSMCHEQITEGVCDSCRSDDARDAVDHYIRHSD